MWPDRVSNSGPLTYESGAIPTALHSLARYYIVLYFFHFCLFYDLSTLLVFVLYHIVFVSQQYLIRRHKQSAKVLSNCNTILLTLNDLPKILKIGTPKITTVIVLNMTRCPVLQLWIHSAEVWGGGMNVVRRMGSQQQNPKYEKCGFTMQ